MIRDFRDRVVAGAGPSRLRWWVCFSGALHLAMIVTLLVVPASTARRDFPVPVYAVDLVTGPLPALQPHPVEPAPREPKPAPVETVPSPEDDEIGEVPVEPVVPEPPKTVKAPKKTPPAAKEKKAKKPPEPKVKKTPPKKRKKVVKPKKKPVKPRKAVKRKKPARPKVTAKKTKASKKRPVKVAGKAAAKPKPKVSPVVERVRQTRIEDAVAIARERARLRQKIGVGQGVGGSGAGAGSGGLLKGREFVVYLNEMRDIFKERWTWIGKRRDLEATVSFGVRADGEIFGLKLLERSGDAAYDESVVRAVRRSVLPPPPRRYAREFAEVEFTFRPDPEG